MGKIPVNYFPPKLFIILPFHKTTSAARLVLKSQCEIVFIIRPFSQSITPLIGTVSPRIGVNLTAMLLVQTFPSFCSCLENR